MSNGSVNLPIVIQQAGDVSRMQEMTQRVGEQQQAAAGAEVVREQARRRDQVQKSEGGLAENRVRADDRRRGQGGGREPGGRKQGRGGSQTEADQKPSLVDVVV